MHLPDSDRLDHIVRENTVPREYAAFLREYNQATGIAHVVTSLTSTQIISVSVSAALRLLPGILQPGVRVQIRRVGNYPPLLTDVLAAAQ